MYFLSGCILKTCEKLDLLAITLKLEYIFFFDKTIRIFIGFINGLRNTEFVMNSKYNHASFE